MPMEEVALFPWWVPVFLTIWSVVGPIVGLFIGNYLSRSSQRRQWIADSQKQEYMELLRGFNRLNMELVAYRLTGIVNQASLKQATEDISTAANTSLFITEFLAKTKVVGELHSASERFANGGNFEEYRDKYWNAVNLILDTAKKIKV
jgi:hypothetical protein